MARPVGFAGSRMCASGFVVGLVLLIGAGVILFSHEDAPTLAEAPVPERRRLASTGFVQNLYNRFREHVKHHHGHDVQDVLVPVASSNAGVALGLNIIGLIFAFFYWKKVVKKVPRIPPQPDSYDDDFGPSLFECCSDLHECLHAACCGTCRNAHTYHVAGIMNYWQALILQLIITNCCSCCCIPCCFFTYMRVELKHHLGLEASPLKDCLAVACCLPCTVGQQALAVDELGGVDVHCCCNVTFAHHYDEQGPLMGGMQGRNFR